MNFDISKLQGALTRRLGNTGLLLAKHSPTILIGAGVVGVVASTVLACKATMKLQETLDASNNLIDQVKSSKESFDKAPEGEMTYEKALTIAHVGKGLTLARLYAPAVVLGTVSVAAIIGSHHILTRRNAAVMAAYAVIDESYKKYRARVIEDQGEEKDHEYRFGMAKAVEQPTVTPEDDVVAVLNQFYERPMPSDYARFFDETSPQWRKDPGLAKWFLMNQQNFANDMLRIKGHLFLNEVYEMLGIPKSQAGQVVGWLYKTGGKDSFVDFGLFNGEDEQARDFVNGYSRSVLLDFNVQGIIWDKI